MTAQHTPTPWQVITVRGATQVSGNGKIIASIVQPAEANAAHIVRCVNAHDELVAALQLAQKVLDALALDDDCTEGQPEAAHAVRAALAKAAIDVDRATLPPLPEPFDTYRVLFTDGQMKAYARAALAKVQK
jgi:hypothetical protein